MVDFEGQKLAETIFYFLIISFGGVGWVIGYIQQDFTVVFQAWLVGVVLSVIVSKTIVFYSNFTSTQTYPSLQPELANLYCCPPSVKLDLRARLAILQSTSRQVAGFYSRPKTGNNQQSKQKDGVTANILRYPHTHRNILVNRDLICYD